MSDPLMGLPSGVLLTWSVSSHPTTVAFSHTPHSDSAVKQILLSMNEKQSFIIEDLDDFHVVIKADDEYRVRRDLEAEVRSCPFFVINCTSEIDAAAREEHLQP